MAYYQIGSVGQSTRSIQYNVCTAFKYLIILTCYKKSWRIQKTSLFIIILLMRRLLKTNAPCLWNLHVITVYVSLYIHKVVGWGWREQKFKVSHYIFHQTELTGNTIFNKNKVSNF